MDQHEQHDIQYEAPAIEELDVAEGPASVAAGNTVPTQIPA